MTLKTLFPTFIYSAALERRAAPFNRQLLAECRQLRKDDAAGRRWSDENYPGGYTSYGSVHWLQRISPTLSGSSKRSIVTSRSSPAPSIGTLRDGSCT